MSGSVLVFTVDGHRCAIDVLNVRAIVRAVAVTPLAGLPEGVDGVCDVHGVPLPVVSLRARLLRADRPVRSSDYFLIASVDDWEVALRVDDVVAVEASDKADAIPIEAASVAVARASGGLVMVQEVDGLLTLEERARLETLLSTGAEGAQALEANS